jgi:DNA-directed RNA polymerase subunit RPC12/RpoP
MTYPTGGTVSPNAFPCGGCGARVEFAPGTTVMRCPYCGYQQQITAGDRQIREHTIAELATLPRKPVGSIGAYVYVCQRCAARTTSNESATPCQFCGTPLVLDPNATGQIVPEAVLPFALDHNGVRESLKKWINSRWFAPNALRKVTTAESTKGTYVPHWTYDSQTYSSYTGQRGEHYYVTERFTDSDGRTQTRQVRKTRWYPVSGQVSRFFDDVLVPASLVVPSRQMDAIAPWPLPDAQPFQPQYMAGFHALRYDVEPENGLEEAKNRMAPVIADDCRRDIGGDEQRVDAVNTNHTDLVFKLMLLPVWIASYVYAGKNWQVLMNGRTGEISGERPYSKLKIAIAVVLAVLAAIVLIYLFVAGHHTTTHHH